MKKLIQWLKENLDKDLYEYYEIKKNKKILKKLLTNVSKNDIINM